MQFALLESGNVQPQAPIEDFCAKIEAGKHAQITDEFMIAARCESFITGAGLEDALKRCNAYAEAGADAVLIHSKAPTPDEVLSFAARFREDKPDTPIIVVPTTYSGTTEDELAAAGIKMAIYANHMLRSAYPAMKRTAETILENGRALEANAFCMPIKEIVTLI